MAFVLYSRPGGREGNAGHNILRGLRLATVDFPSAGTLAWGGLRPTAEAQSFNLMNRANFNHGDAMVD